jgi:hypothetical protein
MRWWGRERTAPLREKEPLIGYLDRYDPCEIDPPSYMFARIGVAVAIVLCVCLAAEHGFNLTH